MPRRGLNVFLGNGEGDAHFRFACCGEKLFDVALEHLARSLVDGGFAGGIVEARQGESAHARSSCQGDCFLPLMSKGWGEGVSLGADFDAVGHIGVVACFLDAEGVAVGVPHCHVDGFAVGEDDGHFGGCLAFQQA